MSTIAVSTGRSKATLEPRTPLPTRQSRPRYIALGVLLIVGLAAAGAWMFSSAGAKTPVVVVTRAVPAGHPITRADLSTVEVAGAVTAVAGKNLASVIGQNAAVSLLPNMLLQRSMLTQAGRLGPGQTDVGVAVTSGQIPADGLEPGDSVRVLQLPSDDADSSSTSSSVAEELVPQAKVFAVRADPAQAGGTLLTLTVPSAQSALVATASSAGRVALLRVNANS